MTNNKPILNYKEESFGVAFLKYGTLLIIFMLLIFKFMPDFYEHIDQQDSSFRFTYYSNRSIPECYFEGNKYSAEDCAKIINLVK